MKWERDEFHVHCHGTQTVACEQCFTYSSYPAISPLSSYPAISPSSYPAISPLPPLSSYPAISPLEQEEIF